jgi:TetR/AcrR family transcriptional regulator, transcriptional repressor for nem operon
VFKYELLIQNDHSGTMRDVPKPRSYERHELITRAMEYFWQHGYYATSIHNLVTVTGVSRHGLYSQFNDKHGLFVACIEAYFEDVVTPAFSQVEAPEGGLADIRGYFERQVELAIQKGLPGPGCLVANTMVESAPHDAVLGALVARHIDRLKRGFRHALLNEYQKQRLSLPIDIDGLAQLLVMAAQGLWSMSRMEKDPKNLRLNIDQLMAPVEKGFAI